MKELHEGCQGFGKHAIELALRYIVHSKVEYLNVCNMVLFYGPLWWNRPNLCMLKHRFIVLSSLSFGEAP